MSVNLNFNMNPEEREVYVTYVDREGPFLKLWVQLQRNSATFVEKLIKRHTEQFERGYYVPHPSTLTAGGIYCAKYTDGVYYRARIISLANMSKGEISVQFIDYGNTEIVPLSNIRSLQAAQPTLPNPLNAIPDQATECFLAGVLPASGQWTDNTIRYIREKLCYEDLRGIFVGEVAGKQLLVILSAGSDFSQLLVQDGIAVSITPHAQVMLGQTLQSQHIPQQLPHPELMGSWQSQSVPQVQQLSQPAPSNPAAQLAAMRAARTNVSLKKSASQQESARVFGVPMLEVNSEHMVYISYIDDGPFVFSVQLKAIEEQLVNLSNEINATPQQPMLKPLLPGSVCLGRFTDDKTLCRAVVMSVMDDKYRLYFVDFGNTDVVPYSEIYAIPDRYMNLKSMALRFSLAGLRDISITTELKEEFGQIVMGKLLKLKVVSPEGPPVKQYCDLYVDGKNVRDLLIEKFKAQQVARGYKSMPPPAVGGTETVVISYIESVASFYVQLECNLSGLNSVMSYLASYCTQCAEGISPSQLQVGMPCCALFSADEKWYRARITTITDPSTVEVIYVDYGNLDTVPISSLRKIDSVLVSQLHEQAIHCALNGYQNGGTDDEVSANFEFMTADKVLTMRVVQHLPAKILVDLFDSSTNPPKNIATELITPQSNEVTIPVVTAVENVWEEEREVEGASGSSNSVVVRKDQRRGRGLAEDGEYSTWKQGRKEAPIKHWQSKKEENGSEDFDDNSRYVQGRGNDDFRRGGRFGGERHGRDSGRFRGNDTDGDLTGTRFHEKDSSSRRFGNDSENDRFGEEGAGGYGRYGGTNRGRGSGRPMSGGRDYGDGSGNRFRERDSEGSGKYESNRGGRFGSRVRDGEGNGRFDDNRGSRYNDQDREMGGRRGGKFDDRENYRGGGRGGRRFGTSYGDEGSNSEESRGSNFKKWDRRPADNEGRKDRWNSRNNYEDRNKNFKFSGEGESSAISNEEEEWNDTDSSVKGIPPVDISLNSVQTMQLVYVVNPVEFYLQFAENPKLVEMMEKISTQYADGGGTAMEELKEGAVCVALYPVDETWYRAIIETVNSDSVTVKFIDYGNSDEISKSNLKVLEPEFVSLPCQAVKCKLLCVKPKVELWSEEEILRFGEVADGKLLETHFVNYSSGCYEVVLKVSTDDTSKSVNEYFGVDPIELERTISIRKSTPTIPLEPTMKTYASNGDKFQLPNIATETNEKVIITWFIDPDNFYCQMLNSQSLLRDMMEDIQKSYRKKPQVRPDIIVGSPVIAKFKEDKVLYRAEVIQLKGSAAIVKFVDYGNCDLVNMSNIWPIESKFVIMPVYSIFCCLRGVKPIESAWPVGGSDFDKYFAADALECTFHECDGKKYSVSLQNCGSNVAETLISSGIAASAVVAEQPVGDMEEELDLKLCVGQYLTAHVTYIYSVSKFFVQLNAIRALEIQAQIQNYIQNNAERAGKLSVDNVVVGDMCLATPDGTSWYRASILEVKSESILVEFIDFGDTAEVSLDKVAPITNSLKCYYRMAIQCCVVGSDLDVPSELQEQFKLEVEEQDVILQVDCVVEDRLVVRLFDVEGHRLELLRVLSDETQIQEIAPVCPLPILSRKMKVWISHVNDGPYVWLQNVNDTDTLTQLLETLFEFYETNAKGQELKEVTIGRLCAAKSANDDSWYRARIEASKDEDVTILFIDYGNEETVSISNMKILDESFYVPHAMAIKALLPLKVTDNTRAVAELQNLIAVKEFMATFAKSLENELWLVDLVSDGKHLTEELVSLDVATEIEDSPFEKDLVVRTVTTGMKASVYITHVDSPNQFWVQLGSNVDDIERLRNSLQKITNTAESFKIVPPKNSLCAAQFSEDASWYRAVILNSESSAVTVRFIDYGNTDTLNINSGAIKALKAELVGLPAYGIQCSLPISPVSENEDWPVDAIKKFQEMVEEVGGVMLAEVISDDDIKVVELFMDECSVSNVLIDLKFALPTAVISSTSCNVFVSHINSPSEFWVQMEESSEQLCELSAKLEGADSFAPLSNLSEKAFCVAKFPDDQQWYRASIISFSEEILVFFIDYGNTAVVNEVRSMPEDISDVPPLAKCCSLNSAENVVRWSETASAKFLELVGDGTHTFKMQILKDLVPLVVSLELEGNSVEDMLQVTCDATIHECEKNEQIVTTEENKDCVFVTHCSSPSDFWVQYKISSTMLSHISEQLEKAENFSNFSECREGMLCAALFPDDGQWYRAQIILQQNDVFEILFIDFGNKSRTDELRILPQSLSDIPPLAKHCSLHFPDDVIEWPEAACEHFTELVNDGMTEFQLKILIEGTPHIVSLFLNGESVELKLKTLCRIAEPTIRSNKENFEEPVDTEVKISNLQENSNCVFVTHCNSPSDFWVQYKASKPQLTNISNQMANAIEFDSILNPKEGLLCAALCTDDSQWYRARIISCLPEGYEVLFVDYGNQSTSSEVRALPQVLCDVPPLAKHCSLYDGQQEWSETAVAWMIDITANGTTEFTLKVLTESDPCLVSLSLGEELLELKLKAFFPDPVYKGEENSGNEVLLSNGDTECANVAVREPVVISHLSSASDFYVQFQSHSEQLNDIVERMLGAANFDPLQEAIEGSLCAALFPEDEQWYRAQIKTCNESDIEILFLDYGNVSTSTELQSLPDDLAKIPPLAIHCCLPLPSGFEKWSEEAEALFVEEYGDGSNIFDLTVLQDSDPKVVSLSRNGTIIEEKLAVCMKNKVDGMFSKNETENREYPYKENSEINEVDEVDTSHAQNLNCETVSVVGEDHAATIKDNIISLENSTQDQATVTSSRTSPCKLMQQTRTEHSELLIKDLSFDVTAPDNKQKHISPDDKIVPGSISRGVSFENLYSSFSETEIKVENSENIAPAPISLRSFDVTVEQPAVLSKSVPSTPQRSESPSVSRKFEHAASLQELPHSERCVPDSLPRDLSSEETLSRSDSPRIPHDEKLLPGCFLSNNGKAE